MWHTEDGGRADHHLFVRAKADLRAERSTFLPLRADPAAG